MSEPTKTNVIQRQDLSFRSRPKEIKGEEEGSKLILLLVNHYTTAALLKQ